MSDANLNDIQKMLNMNSISMNSVDDADYKNSEKAIADKFDEIIALANHKPDYYVDNDSSRRTLHNCTTSESSFSYTVTADGYYFIQIKADTDFDKKIFIEIGVRQFFQKL